MIVTGLIMLLILCCLRSCVTSAISIAVDDHDVVGSNNKNDSMCDMAQNCTLCYKEPECYWCWRQDDNYKAGGVCFNSTSQSDDCQSPMVKETNSCTDSTIPLAVVIIAILIPICCFCIIVGSCTYLCLRVTSKRVDPMIDPRFNQQYPGAFYPPGALGHQYGPYVGQDPYAYGHAVPANVIVIPSSQVSIPVLDAQVIPMTTMKPYDGATKMF